MAGKLPSFFNETIEAMLNLCLTVYLLSTAAKASISAIYAPVICVYCSPTDGDWRE